MTHKEILETLKLTIGLEATNNAGQTCQIAREVNRGIVARFIMREMEDTNGVPFRPIISEITDLTEEQAAGILYAFSVMN